MRCDVTFGGNGMPQTAYPCPARDAPQTGAGANCELVRRPRLADSRRSDRFAVGSRLRVPKCLYWRKLSAQILVSILFFILFFYLFANVLEKKILGGRIGRGLAEAAVTMCGRPACVSGLRGHGSRKRETIPHASQRLDSDDKTGSVVHLASFGGSHCYENGAGRDGIIG